MVADIRMPQLDILPVRLVGSWSGERLRGVNAICSILLIIIIIKGYLFSVFLKGQILRFQELVPEVHN